jgi:hypothetical protein
MKIYNIYILAVASLLMLTTVILVALLMRPYPRRWPSMTVTVLS